MEDFFKAVTVFDEHRQVTKEKRISPIFLVRGSYDFCRVSKITTLTGLTAEIVRQKPMVVELHPVIAVEDLFTVPLISVTDDSVVCVVFGVIAVYVDCRPWGTHATGKLNHVVIAIDATVFVVL